MNSRPRRDLTHDLFLPTVLFATLGGMSWAVRGSAGFGSMKGCIFAGVLWGAAWWFISREPGGKQTRRYSSGWIVLALTIGVGVAGERGWMQWRSFFNERLYTDYGQGEFIPIDRSYGFLWLFLAGIPWAGLGACLLAWCGSGRPTRAWQWAVRIGCGFAGAYLLTFLLRSFPDFFLPLYDTLAVKYNAVDTDPEFSKNVFKLARDTREGLTHLGFYLGFLAFEIGRRDWKNVTLILTVGLFNGACWSLLQNWQWANKVWPGMSFNWWRCWESSGGISIGLAYGVAYFLVNRRMSDEETARRETQLADGKTNGEWLSVYLGLVLVLSYFILEELEGWGITYLIVAALFGIAYHLRQRGKQAELPTPGEDPNLERFGTYSGVLFGVLLSLMNGIRGVSVIYKQNEDEWRTFLWNTMGPLMLMSFLVVVLYILMRPLPRDTRGDVFPHAAVCVWFVIVVQNLIAQGITGPLSQWNETIFNIYYVLLFLITAPILIHYGYTKRSSA